MNTKKYIYERDNDREHFFYCEKNHYPYIEIYSIDKEMCEIFYDITNLVDSNNLKSISSELYRIYESYTRFFLIAEYSIEQYLIEDYFFRLSILKIHADVIANGLFDFLVSKINMNT